MAGVAGRSGGARPGAGRKPRKVEDDIHELLRKAWTQEDREQAIEMLSNRARAGAVDAAKLLFAYAYGQPVQTLEHSGKNGGPIEHRSADEEAILNAADVIRAKRERLSRLV